MSFAKYPPTNIAEAIDVIEQDSEILHNIVHGDENTEVLTENGLVPSIDKVLNDINTQADNVLAGIQAEADRAAAAAGKIYETSAAGQADVGRVDGDYFWVVSALDANVLELWRKGASLPTDTTKRTVSSVAYTELKSEVFSMSDFFGTVANLTAGALTPAGGTAVATGYTRTTGSGSTAFPVISGAEYYYTGVIDNADYVAVIYRDSGFNLLGTELSTGTYNRQKLNVPTETAWISACTLGATPVVEYRKLINLC